MHRKHRSRSKPSGKPVSTPFLVEEVQTEITINRTNVTKLVFHESDEGSNSDCQIRKVAFKSTQPIRNRNKDENTYLKRFVPQSAMMRPSMMRCKEEEEYSLPQLNDLGDFIVKQKQARQTIKPEAQEQYHTPNSQSTPSSNQKKSQREIRSSRRHQKHRMVWMDQQLNLESSTPSSEHQRTPEQIRKVKEDRLEGPASKKSTPDSDNASKKITMPGRKIADITFEAQEEQVSILSQKEIPASDMLVGSSLAQANVSRFTIDEHLPCENSGDQQQQVIDITSTNPVLLKNSLYFPERYNKARQQQWTGLFMLQPLHSRSRAILQLRVNSTLFDKTYQIWVDIHQQMTLMMQVKKYIWPSKTIYQFLTYQPVQNEFCLVATMQSNIDRNEYQVLVKEGERNRVIGNICILLSLKDRFNFVMYYPAVGNENIPLTFIQGDIPLKTIYRHNKDTSFVNYLMTHRMKMDKRLEMMGEFGLRASNKSMEFKGSNNQLIMILGKKASKEYRMIIGGGVSPIQATALSISHIQNW